MKNLILVLMITAMTFSASASVISGTCPLQNLKKGGQTLAVDNTRVILDHKSSGNNQGSVSYGN